MFVVITKIVEFVITVNKEENGDLVTNVNSTRTSILKFSLGPQ